MIQSYMIEDKWINFVLLNGWRLKAEVNEETGDMTVLISNENGYVDCASKLGTNEEVKEVYKLFKDEEESN
tara:strand:+ start:979 stop:1191 length:213 start_codon:yes stop_codon:yes gene_type:complete